MICKFCEQKIEVAAWAGDDGGHRCASGERHEPSADRMCVEICVKDEQLPDLPGDALEVAIQGIADEGCVVVARRSDGAVQVIPEGHIDAEVMRDLLLWAAGMQ